MKTRVHWTWSLGLVLVALPLENHYAQEAPSQPANNPPATAQERPADSTAQGMTDPSDASAAQAENDLTDAAFQPISTQKPLPANVKPTPPVAEVIRLAESGVEEGVILAYVTNSPNAFNLGPDSIIYLNDIGVPSPVVTAMIQRDQALKGLPANNAVAAASAPGALYAPVPQIPAPNMTPAPPPEEMVSDTAPPPDYGPADSPQSPDNGTYSSFYDTLAPYGTWVDVAGYGPCWQPTAVIGNPYWQPYLNCGHWVYTDCGWYWLSGYSWGWAPFHYGRWFCHNRLGWCWAPDTVWGPSWVCWRYGATYCAWAPLPPGAGYRPGVGLTFYGKPVGSAFGFGLAARSYAAVPFNHFWDHHLPRYAVPDHQVSQVLSRTAPSASIVGSNNRVINNGLPPSRVAAATGASIRRVAIHDSYAAGGPGVRAERLEASGTAVTAFRPSFSPHAATQPATAAWINRSAVRDNSAGLAAPGPAYGAGNSSQSAAGDSRTVVEITRSGALIMRGQKETTPGPAYSYSSPRNLPQTVDATHNNSPRPDLYQQTQTQPGVASELPRPAAPAWSAPQPVPAERHYSAPSYPAPEVPRAAPAPAAPAAPSHPSSDKYGR